MLLSELAGLLGLEVAGIDKDITGVNTLDKAGPTELSFLANKKYEQQLQSTRAAAVVVEKKYAEQIESALISENPYQDLARAMHIFSKPQGCLEGQHELAFVHETAEVNETATLYPFCFVGASSVIGAGTKIFSGVYVGENCNIGAGCIIYPNCVIMAGTKIGAGVILQPGAVIGGDGFGYAQVSGQHVKIPQIGNVEIGDQVEIGANAAVDRAALDVTKVGSGTKIDNLVQVAHNVQIGSSCLLISQSGVAGSTKIGDGVVIAAQAGVVDNISIGNGAIIGAQAGVSNNVAPGFIGSGSPLLDKRSYLRSYSSIKKLPKISRSVSSLEKRIAKLEEMLNQGK
jgi:UDP-3-O-[3-hydroxymyristoyl] glucosamine N-acyltransferase